VVPRLEGALTTKELVPRPVEFLSDSHHLCTRVRITESGHLKVPTAGNVQLGCKGHLLADFGHAACTGIVQEPFEMEDEDRGECVDVHRLRRVQSRAGPNDRSDLYGLRRRNVCEGIFDRVNLIALQRMNTCDDGNAGHTPGYLTAGNASLRPEPSLFGEARAVSSGISRQTCG
jgi:hypothetical protein